MSNGPDPNKCFLKYFYMSQPLLREQMKIMPVRERRRVAMELNRCDKAMLRWAKHEDFDVHYVTGITGELRILE